MSLAVIASGPGFYDDEEPLISATPEASSYSGTRLPDGRTLAWREYGNPRGVPCILVPDVRSSRLAPDWLLHDTALPQGLRLIAVDRPGTGASDAIGFGGVDDPADDLARMVQTLAIGKVVLIGIGFGADAVLALADHRPTLVTSVMAVSVRTEVGVPETRWLRKPFSRRAAPWSGPLDSWARAAGRASLIEEQTWDKARTRMEPLAASALGNRWRDTDFRAAVAADLAQTPDGWIHPERPERPAWVDRWSSSVPVRCWHGREESVTHVSTIRAIAKSRPNWMVTAVAGNGALLGAWQDILSTAHGDYLRTQVR